VDPVSGLVVIDFTYDQAVNPDNTSISLNVNGGSASVTIPVITDNNLALNYYP